MAPTTTYASPSVARQADRRESVGALAALRGFRLRPAWPARLTGGRVWAP